MNKYLAGIISGFLATVVISLLMMLKQKYGFLSEFNIIEDFSQFFGDGSRRLGWIVHFVLGSIIWGSVFALIVDIMPGPHWLRGAIFGIIVWALMMVGYMPVMEHGFFAQNLGINVLIASLVLHTVFGFVIGITYGFLPKANIAPETT